MEAAKSCQVNIDTTAPTTSGLKAVTVKSGKKAKFDLRVSDMKGTSPLSPTAVLTLTRSVSLRGKVLKVTGLGAGPRRHGHLLVESTLRARASYTYSVAAVDAAGNPRPRLRSQKLIVK